MAKIYKPYLPEQDLSLPPSLRDWLPENRLVYCVGCGGPSGPLGDRGVKLKRMHPRNVFIACQSSHSERTTATFAFVEQHSTLIIISYNKYVLDTGM